MVSLNLQDVVSLLAPGVELPATCRTQNQLLRGEVTVAGEAMAALKFAIAKRILFFGWDESTKMGDAVFACTCQVEYFDGTREQVCLRGLSILPGGGTSKALLEHIEKRILTYSRRLLAIWAVEHERQHGSGSWAAAGAPPAASIGLHRLCEDTVLMTDTCNGARCTKRMLESSIMAAIEEHVGAAAWEAMDEATRDLRYRVIRADCQQHLRNVLISAMATAGDSHVKEVMRDSLDEFSAFERIEAEGMSVIRGAFSYFHHGGEYAKGRGREFQANLRKKHASEMCLRFERAMGSRQDLAFDGCMPLYMNRLRCLSFLRAYVECPKSQNVLEKSLYTLLKCNEFVALLRVNTLWKLLFSEPYRWLAGKTSKLEGFSLFKMNEVLEHIEAAMEKLVSNPVRTPCPFSVLHCHPPPITTPSQRCSVATCTHGTWHGYSCAHLDAVPLAHARTRSHTLAHARARSLTVWFCHSGRGSRSFSILISTCLPKWLPRSQHSRSGATSSMHRR